MTQQRNNKLLPTRRKAGIKNAEQITLNWGQCDWTLQDGDDFNIGSRWQAVISLCAANTAGFDAGNLSVPWAPWFLHHTEIRAKLPSLVSLQVYSTLKGGVFGYTSGGWECICVGRWGLCSGTEHVNTTSLFNKFGDKKGFPSNPHWMAFHTFRQQGRIPEFLPVILFFAVSAKLTETCAFCHLSVYVYVPICISDSSSENKKDASRSMIYLWKSLTSRVNFWASTWMRTRTNATGITADACFLSHLCNFVIL